MNDLRIAATSRRRYTARVCGHSCLDIVLPLPAQPDLTPGALNDVGRLEIRPGGCVANTGLTLAALGTPVELVTDIGDDWLGAHLRAALTTSGTTVRVNTRDDVATSHSLILQPSTGDRTVFHHLGANASFDGTDLPDGDTDYLHIGYPPLLPALTAHAGHRFKQMLTVAKARDVTTSVDMAFVDPTSPAGRVDWNQLLRTTMPLIDVFTPSCDDLASATGESIDPTIHGLTTQADRMIGLGAAIVMITAGSHGLLVAGGARDRLAATPVLAPIAEQWAGVREFVAVTPGTRALDTTGAGDAAAAGLIDALLRGCDPAAAARAASDTARSRVTRQPLAARGSPPPTPPSSQLHALTASSTNRRDER
jgi:sugar/nucleoside kinase (ribokinase family)